ncbi:MAG TPA: VOC family protein [Blastocatellia bacterium]|nr:VOC family protein [Blastocatellia bacterium]
MFTRIGSVPIFVSDQERALAFYRDKLGFEVVLDQQYGPEFRWVTVARQEGETELVLFRPVPSIAGNQLKELEGRIGIWTGITFLTADINATYQTLRQRGVEFQTEPTRQAWGGTEALFSDPDGNYFHLVQRPGS